MEGSGYDARGTQGAEGSRVGAREIYVTRVTTGTKEDLEGFLHELVDIAARHDSTLDELDRRTVGSIHLGGL